MTDDKAVNNSEIEGGVWRFLGRLEGKVDNVREGVTDIKQAFSHYGERLARLEAISQVHETRHDNAEKRLDAASLERESFKAFMHRNAGIQYGLQFLILIVTALNLLGVFPK